VRNRFVTLFAALFVSLILASGAATASAQEQAPQTSSPSSLDGPGAPGAPPKPFHHMTKWWKDSDTVRQLQLTDVQAQQIEQTFTAHRLRFIDEMADLQKQELKLGTVLDAAQPDEGQFNAQVEQLIAARGRLEKEHAAMMLNIRRTLSLDQWNKVQSLHGEPMMGHHHMGDGPHGPPPPGPPQ
jgi:Spy/CpxP family protein refolding chaperone